MYKLIYDKDNGKVSCIQNGNMTIPISERNADFRDFLIWNSKQEVPLDLKSTVEVVPPEKVVSVEEEVANLKAQVAVLSKTADTSKLTAEEIAVLSPKEEIL